MNQELLPASFRPIDRPSAGTVVLMALRADTPSGTVTVYLQNLDGKYEDTVTIPSADYPKAMRRSFPVLKEKS